MNVRRRVLRTPLVALVAALSLAGCTGGSADTAPVAPDPATAVETAPEADNPPEPAWDTAPPHGTGQTLRVGIRFDQPGVGLMTDGQPSGFDVDVAAYVAHQLGYSPYDIDWVEVRPENREQLLTQGAVDLVVAAYSITDERAAQVEFAGPYLITGQGLLVRAEEQSVFALSDLAGKTVCEVPGSTSVERIEAALGAQVQVVEAPGYAECAQRVVDGTADAVSTDDIILAGLAASDDYFALVKLVGEPLSQEAYGIGLPPDSTARCQAVNAALTQMVADGSWQRFIDRHTGGTGYDPSAYDNPPTPAPCA